MLKLSQKQQQAVQAVNNPNIDTLVLFGTVGTGKTDVACHIVISICMKFPETYWPVFRLNITTAKKSIIPSYLTMLGRMNLYEGIDYQYNRTESFIRFPNGSIIPFMEADSKKDRDGKKIKGVNATGNHIDEADELLETMLTQATSRKGRRNENGQPSLSIYTLNPTDVKHLVKLYDQYKDGTLPSNICCIEFTVKDSWQTESDIAAMFTNPKWWVERYLRNNWKFKDEEKTIFKSELFAKSIVKTFEPGKKTSGYDVADEGVDRAGCADWENMVLKYITITKDRDQKVKSEIQAKWIIDHSDNNEIGYENIAVDGVGNGVGVISAGRMLGADFAVFKSGYAPDPMLTFKDKAPTIEEVEKQQEILSFNNLRSQVAYLLADGMDKGYVKILDSCPFLDDFQDEAQQHHNEIKEKAFILESKEKIKARTGKSPDIFDMVLMGFWKQLKKQAKLEYGGVY